MWALVCVIVVMYAVVQAWIRSWRPWLEFAILWFAYLHCRLMQRGSHNRRAPFPIKGPALVISNHTCSADPILLQAASDRLLSFLVSHAHFDVHPIASRVLRYMSCIPVTRTGQDPGGLLRALRHLQSGGILCIFPEGNLSGVARNRMRRGKLGAAWLALQSRAPVYPVYIAGGARTDRLLHSWIVPSPKSARVIYGDALDLSAYFGRPRTRRLVEELTEFFMTKIEDLNPKRLRGDSKPKYNGAEDYEVSP